MRFVVYGAGAVGGVVGGLLHRAGHDVHLIARGAHLDKIRTDGLRLLAPGFESVEQIPASASPANLTWTADDVVLLAVKSDATAGVLSELARHALPDTPVVCLQNGVANEPAALRWFANVYGVCVLAPTEHLEPGVVAAKSGPVAAILDIGRFPGGVDETARRIAAAFESAGIISVPRPDIMRWKYRKLVMNLTNAIDAACAPGDDAQALRSRLRDEGEAVLAAAGITVATVEEDEVRRGDILKVPAAGSDRPAQGGSSSYQSLARGTGSIESDWLNGEIVRIARTQGADAPVNDLARRHANAMAAGHVAPRTLSASTILAELDVAQLDPA
ncbi:MAG: Ketopantoate reductase [Marmoricola sp.]|nr:Ketopantoate reductase [Marmoricola sp.]